MHNTFVIYLYSQQTWSSLIPGHPVGAQVPKASLSTEAPTVELQRGGGHCSVESFVEEKTEKIRDAWNHSGGTW